MARYPEDLLTDATKDAELEQARLEAQLEASKGTKFGTVIAAPEDNPVYNIEKHAVVTPAIARQSAEVLARHTAATELSLPTGEKEGAEANIQTVKDAFGITDPE